MNSTIWTLGHSTRSLNKFLALLAHYKIEAVADVRRFPGSVTHPYTSPARIVQGQLSHVLAEGEALAQKRELANQKRPDLPAQFGK